MNTRILIPLLLILLLSGCYIGPSSLAINPTPVLTPVYRVPRLIPQNVNQAIELINLSVEKPAAIAAITFTSDGQELLAVYGQEGVLRRWRLVDSTLLASMNIGPSGMAAVSFDAQAQKVAIGAGKTPLTIQAGYDADFAGVRLWDTQTGKLLFEIEPEPNPKWAVFYTDVALSPDGRWLVGVTEGGSTRWDATTGERMCGGAYMGEVNIRTDEHIEGSSLLDVVTFDPTGEMLAYATESGYIGLERREGSGESRCEGMHMDSIRLSGDPLGVPLALSIDPSRRWLAAVMGKTLEVRGIQWGQVALKAEVGEGPLAGLAFSADGKLLAVGTIKGWQIWSVDKWKLLLENAEQSTYAVAFSPDGRLFAWGDVGGVVHLWGVPEK